MIALVLAFAGLSGIFMVLAVRAMDRAKSANLYRDRFAARMQLVEETLHRSLVDSRRFEAQAQHAREEWIVARNRAVSAEERLAKIHTCVVCDAALAPVRNPHCDDCIVVEARSA